MDFAKENMKILPTNSAKMEHGPVLFKVRIDTYLRVKVFLADISWKFRSTHVFLIVFTMFLAGTF